jgi:uncharacterized protein (TIGR02271 family)
MKTEKQTKFKQYVGHEMAEQRGEKTVRKGKISRDFIKSPGVSLGLSLLAAASLALVSGCCSSGGKGGGGETANYAPVTGPSEQPVAAATTTTEAAPSGETMTVNAGANTNMVIPLYTETASVGKQEQTSQVRVRKVVKTETINQPLELRHEEVVVERLPAGSAANTMNRQPFSSGELVINVQSEQPLIQKTITQSGAVAVNTTSKSQQQNITTEVRKEDIDVSKSGNAQNINIGPNIQSSAGGAESPGGQAAGAGGTITDARMLTSTGDASSLAGRSAQLSGLKCQEVISDHWVILSTDDGQKVYAVCDQGITCKPGDKVNVSGTVRPSSNAASITGLSSDAAAGLKAQPVYVEAISITSQ